MPGSETITLTRTRVDQTPGDDVELVIPRLLGSVTLIREIGRGGMGVVWLGRDGMLERDVAVKFLLSAVTSPDDPRFTTFLEGSKAAAAVRHENLTSVLHAGLVESIPYIVMEYVNGPSLSQALRDAGALPLSAALVAIEGACRGTAELHSSEIIHRDLKPGNVMLSGSAGIFVTDFGLAVTRQAGTGAIRASVAGSPSYMAPEMFAGEVSSKTDVYALGITLFELLTGDVPFGGTIEDLERLQRHAPIPVEKLVERKVHAELVEVIERAVHKNALFRYRSAEHFLNAIRQACPRGDQWSRGSIELSQLIAKQSGQAAPEAPAAKADEGSSTLSYYDTIGSRAAQRRQELDSTRGTLDRERQEADEKRKAEERRISEAIELRREEERKRREASKEAAAVGGVGGAGETGSRDAIPAAAPSQPALTNPSQAITGATSDSRAQCEQCGYSLGGVLVQPGVSVCPECGTGFDAKNPWVPAPWPSAPKLFARLCGPIAVAAIGLILLSTVPAVRNLGPLAPWILWLIAFAFLAIMRPIAVSRKLALASVPARERASRRRLVCALGISVNAIICTVGLIVFWALLIKN